jgi:hypothetical protein
MTIETCPTCWRSHGCYLPAGHRGGDDSHLCGPCPEDCTEPMDQDWIDNDGERPDWISESCGSCSIHCGDHPISGDLLYDVTPNLGRHNERRLP